MSVLLYSSITWTLIKCLEKLYGNYAGCCFEQIINTAFYKTAAVQPLTSHPKTIQATQVRHIWHRWRSNDSLTMFSYGHLHIDIEILADQQQITVISSV